MYQTSHKQKGPGARPLCIRGGLFRSWLLILSLTLLIGACASCSSGAPTGKTNPEIVTLKIAADLPVTGPAASAGVPAESGARMALEEANTSAFLPGYTFVFEPQNTTGSSGNADPSVGAVNATAFVSDAEVAGIIGPLNNAVARAEMPISNTAPLVQISPATTGTCLTQNTPDTNCTGPNDILKTVRPTGKVTYFRVTTTDTYQARSSADYAFSTLHYKTAYVVDDATIDGIGGAQAFLKEFSADGGKVVGQDSVKETTNYSQELAEIARLKPQVVYFAGLDSTGGTLLRTQMARTAGLLQTPFMGGDGLTTNAFATAIGAGGGGPVYGALALADASKLPSSSQFLTKYRARYGSPGIYSAAGYDCAKILLNAIKAALHRGVKAPTSSTDADTARTFRQAIIDQVAQMDYTGATGHLTFDASGDTMNKTVTMYRLTDVDGKPGWRDVSAISVP